jgi:hypothetical protein
MDDAEYAEIEAAADRDGETVSQWVRQSLRMVRDSQPKHTRSRKLAALRATTRYEFPTGDIEQLLAETQRGYLE